MKIRTTDPKVMGYGFACMALLLFVLALAILIGALNIWLSSVTTNGTIIGCTMVTTKSSPTECQPTVQFHTASGQQITFTSPSDVSYHKGDVVPVLYHPHDPHNASVELSSMWVSPLFCGGFSLLCWGLSRLFFRIAKKRQGKKGETYILG